MLLSFFNKPFPRLDFDKRSVRNSFFVGCFVACFLFIFQPFGIREWCTENKAIKILGFGFVSFIMPVIFNIIVEKVIHKKPIEDNWTIGKEILTIVLVIIFIAFGNLMYGYFLHITPLNITAFLSALLSVALIGVFPVTIQVLKKHNKLLKINLEEAKIANKYLNDEELEHKDVKGSQSVAIESPIPGEPVDLVGHTMKIPKIVFVAENEKDKIELLPEQLLYIESADNYSNIVFTEETKVKKQMLRSSLKRFESQITLDHITRCHRTFIVNLKNVKNIEGNAAGYKLSFDNEGYSVPVSRNYGIKILEKLKSLK